MARIGSCPMPEDFPYRDVWKKGRPRHEGMDLFRIRHPRMDCGRRAKIFAPFDALRGFRDAVKAEEAPEAAASEGGGEEERACENAPGD